MKGLSKDLICVRAARELKPGMYVNLGIGIPTQVADFAPEGVILHSQNGVLNFGPIASEEEMDWELVNAGAKTITMRLGISFFDSIVAFTMMPGRHLDAAILVPTRCPSPVIWPTGEWKGNLWAPSVAPWT